jgi:hypothetical protein
MHAFFVGIKPIASREVSVALKNKIGFIIKSKHDQKVPLIFISAWPELSTPDLL